MIPKFAKVTLVTLNYFKTKRFEQNKPYSNTDQNALFGFQALRNVSIINNTFNNTLQTDYFQSYELVIQLFDERLGDSYDLSQNVFAINDTRVLVHSFFTGLYLNVKLFPFKEASTKRVDFFGSLFQQHAANNNTVLLKNKPTPYYLNSLLKIDSGRTLIVEPGVVIKVLRDAMILVEGNLVLNGTEQDAIKFADYQNGYVAFDADYPVPHVSWFKSRRDFENIAFIYFKAKSNDDGKSMLKNVVFNNLDRTHIFISRFMPMMENVSIPESGYFYQKSVIAIFQPDVRQTLELKGFNLTSSNARDILIDSTTPVHVSVTNVTGCAVKIVPTLAFDTSLLNDVACNLGPSNSFYLSANVVNPMVINHLFRYPCQIYFNTDQDSHFKVEYSTTYSTAYVTIFEAQNTREMLQATQIDQFPYLASTTYV